MHASIPRAGGFAALAVPVLMWSEFFTHALSRGDGYNLLTRPFSDLATRGTPQANEFDVGFFLIPGVLTIVVGLSLWLAHRKGRLWTLGSLLIVAAGIFLLLTGVFQQDPGSVMAGVLHGTVSQACFAIASVAPLILFLGSTRHTHMDAPRRLWLALGLGALALEGFGVLVRPALGIPYGLFQRPFTLLLTIWFVATGIWLLRLRRKEAGPVPA